MRLFSNEINRLQHLPDGHGVHRGLRPSKTVDAVPSGSEQAAMRHKTTGANIQRPFA
jgi:hypothetical protein